MSLLLRLQDLEEDPELRTNVNIYRDPNKGRSINDVRKLSCRLLDPSSYCSLAKMSLPLPH